MIQVTLGGERLVDAALDPLGRARIGWAEGMGEAELYDIARGTWVLSAARGKKERFLVVVGGGVVRQAIEATAVTKGADGRWTFVGTVLKAGHPVFDEFVGQPAPNGAQQNPITYFDSVLEHSGCACGCGELVPPTREFVSGHDQRAIHDRVAKVGSVREFLDWFDVTWIAD
jgi:hypothetical protein